MVFYHRNSITGELVARRPLVVVDWTPNRSRLRSRTLLPTNVQIWDSPATRREWRQIIGDPDGYIVFSYYRGTHWYSVYS